jgi:hypothetical protein
VTRIASILLLWILITERSAFAFVKSTGKDAATYIKQLANGPVAVYTWDAVRKDRKICQTPYPGGASGKYWTKLQGDGNFVTYSGIYPSTSTRVWKSNVIGASGTYKLDVKCDDKVAIYKEGSNTPLWTCPPAPAPPGCQTATLLKSGEYIFTNQSPWTTKVRPWHVSRVPSHFDFW